MNHISVGLVFKDFAAWVRSSCVGLNVASYADAKVLRAHGISTFVFPVRHNVDVVKAIDHHNETHFHPLTHVIIAAPWLSLYDLKSLIEAYPAIQFVVLCHSNVGFLQADPEAILLLRRYYHLSHSHGNIKIGGNSKRFVHWLRRAYGFGREIVYLPNLYPFEKAPVKRWTGSLPLKIGAFGAVRPEKNFLTAAAAALLIQTSLGIPVELHVSRGGEWGSAEVASAVDQMCVHTGVKVIRHDWQYWDKFIQVVADMDLLLQASYTESFNMITADGISVGVPSVVSSAIYWAPEAWKADSDDATEIAQVGLKLLNGWHADDGVKALAKHNEIGFRYWLRFLGGRPEEKSTWEKIKFFFRF